MRRHDLLGIRPDDWTPVLGAQSWASALPTEAYRLVSAWAERGWPVIVRRRSLHERPGGIPVALPLPPSYGKLRLAFTLPYGVAMEPVPAVSLREALSVAPEAWCIQIRALIALGDRLALCPNIFGALLWERVTGLTYLRSGSDIDLLWPTPRAEILPDLLYGLRGLDADGPARLDGEIRLASGGGVNWRELDRALSSPDGAVLVKTMNGADIRCASTLFD